MLISSTNHSDKGFKLDVKIDDIILSQKEEISYLGVTIDSHLTWLPHIANTCKKLAPKIGALSRLRHTYSLITVYNSTILPMLPICYQLILSLVHLYPTLNTANSHLV